MTWLADCVVISHSSHDLTATDCHVLVGLRTAARLWHACSLRYAQLIWTPADITALTLTLKQRHVSLAEPTASGVMSSWTLASRDRVASSALALMDLEAIPRQYSSAQVLGAWGKPVRCRATHSHCTMRAECAKHAQMDWGKPAESCFGSANSECMTGSATASLYMISSI